MRKLTIMTLLTTGMLAVWAGCQTSGRNPTTLAGRGLPDLEDQNRPAAWVYVDGQAGRFTQRDDEWQMQWVIERPVSPTPTFRVEVYEPLLGSPKDFSCVLQTVEAADGSVIVYGMVASEGRFQAGREYPLLSPGDGFVIRDVATRAVVDKVDPLSPGTYLIAAKIANADTDKEGLAVTYFTVGDGK